MARKRRQRTAPAPVTGPIIHRAELRTSGAVVRLGVLTEREAVEVRRDGGEVVVCGEDHRANRLLAQAIEAAALGEQAYTPHPPHDRTRTDRNALPHFQPEERPPTGHTFDETDNRKSRGG